MKVKVQGTIRVPGDKSISHRALICSALSSGASRVRGILRSADVESTAGVLRAMGVAIPALGDDITIEGVGTRGLVRPSASLDCGNSGTTTRLTAGVVAAQAFDAMFVGDASLSRRPMRRIAKPLEQMGARVEVAAHGGLPMHVHGAELTPIIYESPTASAQVKSAILLAALCAGVDAVVREPAPSRDHTERMLAARGAQVWVNEDAVMLRATRTLAAADVDVPGDPSSAAFFAALAALADSGRLYLSDVSLNTTRAGFMTVLARMGAYVKVTETRAVGGEHLGTIAVSPVANLRGVTVEAAEVPSMIDELPMLACLAAVAEGTTEVTGAAELRVKESDRIATVVRNLRAIGADAEELPDGFRITGSYQRLAGRVETEGDHRLAMAFGVLGAVRGNRIEIDDRECVAVSYPSFWRDLAAATA